MNWKIILAVVAAWYIYEQSKTPSAIVANLSAQAVANPIPTISVSDSVVGLIPTVALTPYVTPGIDLSNALQPLDTGAI